MSLSEVVLIELPKISDPRGNLSFFQNCDQIPFVMKRAYWLYGSPAGEMRDGHAFREQQELIVSLSGCFTIVVSDGQEEKRFTLKNPNRGLFIPKMMWRHMEDFATNSVALVATDKFFDAAQYIRDFEQFKDLRS